jgi:hypothetical protein
MEGAGVMSMKPRDIARAWMLGLLLCGAAGVLAGVKDVL